MTSGLGKVFVAGLIGVGARYPCPGGVALAVGTRVAAGPYWLGGIRVTRGVGLIP